MSARTSRWLLLCCTLVGACTRDAPVQTHQWLALGTVFEITIARPRPDWQTELVPRAAATLDPWAADMYPYRDGELSRANTSFAAGGCVSPSPRLRKLIDTARTLESLHGDRFVPALAQLTQLWRLHEIEQQHWRAPNVAAVAAAMTPPPRAGNLVDQSDQICARGPVALDFGGFAKGLILDELTDVLDALDYQDAIVNAGGDLKVLGTKNGAPWRVAVRNPHASGALAGILARDGEAIFTSGNYERHVVLDGERYGHILDPATGYPLRGIASVTVLGHDATRTDAAATALYVAASRALAHSDGLAAMPSVVDASTFLIIDEHRNAWLSQSMRERLLWVTKPDQVRVVDSADGWPRKQAEKP